MLFVVGKCIMVPTHIVVLLFCFVFLRVYPILPVSLDCTFLISPSVFCNIYFLFMWGICCILLFHITKFI